MHAYEESRAFAQQFDESLQAILGLELYRTASFLEDVRYGIDGTIKILRVAERLRSLAVYPRYKFQITLRYSRPTGTATEYRKLLEGTMAADIYFYGWGDIHSREIKAYVILSVPALRTWLRTVGEESGMIFVNPDGTAGIAFDLRTMPRPVVLTWKRLPDARQLDLFVQRFTHAVIVS
jgi:hypothetical protein